MKNTKKKYKVLPDGRIELAYGPKLKKSTYSNLQKYRDAYVKDNYRQFNIKVNRTKYQDVIDFMESQENLASYLAELIRADMAAKKN